MKTIWKYNLLRLGDQQIEMPKGAKPLSVAMQDGRLVLWSEVDTEQYTTELVTVYIIGTGNPMPERPLRFIGTAQDGLLVWHIFVEGEW